MARDGTGILHTILFNRGIGPTRPREEYIDTLDITYARIDEPLFEKVINEKVDAFFTAFQKTPNLKHQVCFLFAEKREKKSWFSKQEELLPWEQWLIHITIHPSVSAETERARRLQLLEKQLQDVMRQILVYTVEKREHVPQFVSSKKGTFAFEVRHWRLGGG